eukprot:495755-Ditylum_brightwellii.AAC.1
MTESGTVMVIVRGTATKKIGGIRMMVTVRDLAAKKTRGMLTKTERGRSKAEILVMIQKEGSMMLSQIR